MYYSAVCPSPLGMLTLGSDGEHLIGLWLEGQKYFGGAVREALEERDGLPVFDAARDWLARYFAGEKPMPSELPLCPIGGEFRQRVWRLLCQIPYGETTTYGALARALAAQMGRPSMSSQAVGGAVGHNPISIIIPCHRVVGSGGSLTGYAGGIDKKYGCSPMRGSRWNGFLCRSGEPHGSPRDRIEGYASILIPALNTDGVEFLQDMVDFQRLFFFPRVSITMVPWCIIRSRSPYSTA